MTSLTRLQSTPGLSSVAEPAGNFALPRDLSHDAGLIDVIDFCSLKRGRNRVIEVVFNDMGNAFACIDTAGHIVLFYIAKDRFVNLCNSVHPTATFITEKNNGMLIIGLPDSTINVYNLAGKLLTQLKAHKDQIKSFAINYSRNILLSQSEDACVLWSLSSLKIIKVLHSRHTTFSSAIFSPNEETLITCFKDSSIYFWNLETFQLDRRAFLPKNSKPTKMVTSLEGNILIVVGETPLVHMFNLNHEEDHQSFKLPEGCTEVKDVAFLPDGQLLLLGEDGVLHCTDTNQGNKVLFTKGLQGKRSIVSFTTNPQGKFLITVAESGEVFLYDFLKLLAIAERASHKRAELGVSPDLTHQTLKQSKDEKLYHQDFSSKPIGPKDITNNPVYGRTQQQAKYAGENTQQFGYEKSAIRGDNRDKRDTKYQSKEDRENTYQTRTEVQPQVSGQREEIHSPLDSLEEITDSFRPMHSPQSLSVDINHITKPYLASFWNKYGIFPNGQRSHIWNFLLNLPLNAKIYKSLQIKGTHPAFKDFFSQYPKSKLSEKVQAILSCLAHYCEAFAQVDYLPGLIFPFVRIFGDQEVLCFEIILSFLVNWGQHFLQNHPKPPILLLQAIEKLLEYHEPYLYEHLKNLLEDTEGVGIGDILWTFVQNMLTDILKREDWLSLMDFLVLNNDQPKYLLYFLVGYLSLFKDILLKETDKEAILDIGYFVDKKSEVDIYKIFDKMHTYMDKTPVSAILISFQSTLPLVKGDYPSPEFFTPQLRNIYHQMEEYLSEAEKKRSARREQLKEVYKHLEGVSQITETFRSKQEALHEQRLKLKEEMIKDEEEKLRKRSDLEQQRFERRIAQIKMMEEELRACMEKQDRIRYEMRLEAEKEKRLKEQIEEEKLMLQEEQQVVHDKHLEIVERELEGIEHRLAREKAREDRLDGRRMETEQAMKEDSRVDRSRQEEEDYGGYQSNKFAQQRSTSKERDRAPEGRYDRGFDRKGNAEESREWESRVHNREESRYDSTFGSHDYSRGGYTSGEYRNETNLSRQQRDDSRYDSDKFKGERRENMWEKRRNQVTSIGGETDSLQTDPEEDRKKSYELSFNQRNEGIRKISDDRKQGHRKFGDFSMETEEQKGRREIEEELQNRDRIELENQDFERTLRETERRILEDDKLKYEQIREAWREMNTTDEGPRKSPGEGRSKYLDNSREGRDVFEGTRERASVDNKGERSFTREDNRDRPLKKENLFDEDFNTSKEEEKYLERSGEEGRNYSRDQKSREYYSSFMPLKTEEDDGGRTRMKYTKEQDQSMEHFDDSKEVKRRSIGERKNFGGEF